MPAVHLERRTSAGDWRDWLDGQPIHNGDALELLHAGEWVKVRYESCGPDQVWLYGQERVWLLEDHHVLRWPGPRS